MLVINSLLSFLQAAWLDITVELDQYHLYLQQLEKEVDDVFEDITARLEVQLKLLVLQENTVLMMVNLNLQDHVKLDIYV